MNKKVLNTQKEWNNVQEGYSNVLLKYIPPVGWLT